jgi:hypothetical protein
MLLRRSQAVEIPILAGTTLTKFMFPDQAQLRNAIINGIKVYTPGTYTVSPVTFAPLPLLADYKQCFLVLYSGDIELVLNKGVLELNNTSNGTDPFVFEVPSINNMVISWTKSYIVFGAAPNTDAGQLAMPFDVYYNLPQ